MPSVFTDFASSRFIDSKAVVEHLRRCADTLKSQHEGLERIYLFGSFVRGTATPRSDADIALLLVEASREKRDQILDAAREVFSKVPVPVDLHVIGHDQLASSHGLGAVVAREGIEL